MALRPMTASRLAYERMQARQANRRASEDEARRQSAKEQSLAATVGFAATFESAQTSEASGLAEMTVRRMALNRLGRYDLKV